MKWKKNADDFYRILEGKIEVETIVRSERWLAIVDYRFDPADGDDHILVIPIIPVQSSWDLTIADAIALLELRTVISDVVKAMGWTAKQGFRIDIPVNPPYQQEPWLQILITRSDKKKLKPEADAEGYSRDDGHFTSMLNGDRRAEVIYSNRSFTAVLDPEDEDVLEYDAALTLILNRKCVSILDDDFTDEDWLCLISAARRSADRLGLNANHFYMNVLPPYQHTAWVHAHVLAGKKIQPTNHTGDFLLKAAH